MKERDSWAASIVLILIAVVFCIPLLWVLLASFNPNATLAVEWPSKPSLENFSGVMNPETLWRPLWNSLLLCGGGTILTVVLATLAAYPLSRYEFRWKRPLLMSVIFGSCLPITAIMIPVYALFVQVNLIDSIPWAAVFLAAAALPFAIFLMKTFMDGTPKEIEESAWTEGASMLQTLRLVVMPLLRPGTAVVTIMTFVGMWGNFFVPFMLLLSPSKLPAAVSLYTFSSQYGQVAYGQLAAFSLCYSIPVIGLYLILGRRLGADFMVAGGLKG